MRPIFAFGAVIALVVSLLPSTVLASKPFTLPSGNQVVIIGMQRINFAKDVPALMLKYQTNLNVDDKNALRKEADELWQRFVHDVDKAQLSNAIISASEIPKGAGAVSKNRGYNFILKKVDGKWSMEWPSAKEKQAAQLDENSVNEFINLWDATTINLNSEGSMLYMAPDWAGVVIGQGPDGKPQSRTIGLKEFASLARQMHELIANYKYSRSDTAITIAPDGKSATVKSKIAETLTTKDGKVMNTLSETSDVLQLAGGQTTVKSSEQKVLEMK